MTKHKWIKRFILIAIFILLVLWNVGCTGATGNVGADNPIERGLSYIAAAIVTHGIVQAVFNK
jgi:hypothetical protein